MLSDRNANPIRDSRISLYCISFILLVTIFSCAVVGTTTTTTVIPFVQHPGEGSMLFRQGAWLYRTGGLDNAGLSSSSTQMSALDPSGNAGVWQSTASLPAGVGHGAAFAAGNLAYVMGGRNGSGLVSTIYFTLINADGTLGFSPGGRWESNERPLPEARADAAWVVHDGWIFLIGGETASGAVDSIIRAKMYQDGQIGQWYESAQVLPDALWGASAAVLADRLYVAGGADAGGAKLGVVSFALGDYGALSDRRVESRLPQALQEAVLVADREDLILAGGYGDQEGSDTVYRYNGALWATTSFMATAAGPSSGRAGGALFYVPQSDLGGAGVLRLEGLSLAPEAPVVVPGSGMVPNNSPIRVSAEPGVTVRYRTDGGVPSIADPVWPATPIRISTTALPSMKISLAAFSSDGTVSPVIQREYRVRSSSFIIVYEDTLQIHEPGDSVLDSHILQESGPAGTPPTPASSLWYRMWIDTPGTFRLTWADNDENAAFSARIMVSVYEVDLYTEVPDMYDNPALDRRGGSAAPLRLALNRGDYYVLISDIDGMTGRDFGLSLMRE